MNKKLLIVANNAVWSSWPDKINQLKEWFAPRVNLDVTLIHTSHESIPFEVYGSSLQLGVSKAWYDAQISPLGKGYDLILFVVNQNQWQGFRARGWRADATHGAVELQMGSGEFEPFWKVLLGLDGQMFHQVARHEIMHGLFYLKCGSNVRFDLPPTQGLCIDTTHYHFDRGELELALADLVPEVSPQKEILIVHHTATPRDTTNLEAILKDHQARYGRSFYQCFITADGTVHWQHKLLNDRIGAKSVDYCVVGDFTKEKPTEAQLEALNVLVGSRTPIPHAGALSYGATQSLCPGTLLEDLKKHREVLSKLQASINQLMEMIRQLFLKK